jgi:circadian clock protein KaiC
MPKGRTTRAKRGRPARDTLVKAPTGIQGFDEVTAGGLPAGRPTLVCGGPGSGKTTFAMEFLVRGAAQFSEPGVFLSFEEPVDDLATNVSSFGFDLRQLVRQKKLVVDYVRVERAEIEETGEYDLDGLFVRLGHAIDSIGARRVVLDTVEALFAGLSNQSILRAELRRLFGWLKDNGVTAVITGEQGAGTLTRQGLEEYVSDCVILLDHRVHRSVSTRRLRVVKYRGSMHGTNEYPFLIGNQGFVVMPITSLGLDHPASNERVTTGSAELDSLIGGGFLRGSSVLVTGTAGTGKSTLAAQFAASSAQQGERCVYFAFEESAPQITRNMRAIGLNLAPLVRSGRLEFHTARPTLYGLEMHLALMHAVIDQAKPATVVVDPITNLVYAGTLDEAQGMLVRLVDLLKCRGITALFTGLSPGGVDPEFTHAGVSSLMDSWILLRNLERAGARTRGLNVLKARGTAHSNRVHEFEITSRGIQFDARRVARTRSRHNGEQASR